MHKTCLRCDWEGDTREVACPDCGVRLYVVGVPRTATVGAEKPSPERDRSRDAPLPESSSVAEAASRGTSDRRIRAVGVLALVAALLVVTVGSWPRQRDEPPVSAPPTTAVEDEATAGATLPAAAPEPPVPDADAIVGDVRLMFGSSSPPGWERHAFSLNKSTVGPQPAEAIIFWTSFPEGEYVGPCTAVLGPDAGRSPAHLVAAVATAPRTELVRGPSEVIIGGQLIQHAALIVRRDLGCDPGFFFTWPHNECEGACWLETRAGDRISVWVFEVAHTLVVLEAATTRRADSDLRREIREIVGTMRFDG